MRVLSPECEGEFQRCEGRLDLPGPRQTIEEEPAAQSGRRRQKTSAHWEFNHSGKLATEVRAWTTLDVGYS